MLKPIKYLLLLALFLSCSHANIEARLSELETYQKAIGDSVEKTQRIVMTNLLYGDLEAGCRDLFVDDPWKEVVFYVDTSLSFSPNVICVSYSIEGGKEALHLEQLLQRLGMEKIEWN